MATYANGVVTLNNGSKVTNPQNGAWYDGQRLWNGSFAAPGVDTETGKTVSSEVNQAGSQAAGLPANAYDAFVGGQQPKSAGDVASIVNSYQQGVFDKVSGGSPSVEVPTMDELKKQLAPDTAAPALLDRPALRQEYRTENGVQALEDQLTQLSKQEQDLIAQGDQQTQKEEGKPVAMGVISGRVTQVQKNINDQLSTVQRTKALVQNQLSIKYAVIDQLMQDQTLDYNDAVAKYDSEYKRNFDLYTVISGKQKEARDEYWQEQTAARTNLTMYVNAIQNGNMDFSSLSADQKLMIQKLEIQSGLPVGFISSLKMDPKANILFTNSNEGVTQVGFRNADGTISVKSYGTPTGTASKKSQLTQNASAALDAVKGPDGYVDPKDYKTFKSYWVSQGGTADDFDKNFGTLYVNPSSYKNYGVSQEVVNPDAYKGQNNPW